MYYESYYTKRKSKSFSNNKSLQQTAPAENDDLNYSLNYFYAKGFSHRIDHIGDIYYKYDLNGNVTMTHKNPIPGYDSSNHGEESTGSVSDDDFWDEWDSDPTDGHSDFGWGLGGHTGNNPPDVQMVAQYMWDERDRLKACIVGDKNAFYVYGEDGQRSNKWTIYEETLYFNRMWTWYNGNANNDQTAKHIYLGSERIVSQMNSWKGAQNYSQEHSKTYYYHTDHLGSAQLVTDYKGNEYQRIEYTPYGEEWVDNFQNENYVDMTYNFTGKERDEETGLYYYGARYLDAKYSRWLSTDPALGEYIPAAPTNDEAKQHNSKLPGMGGVFNTVNMNLYHYAGNNPVKYVDPDGRSEKDTKKLNENIHKILDGVEKWTPGTCVPSHYNKGVLSKEIYDFLGGINSEKGRPDFWFACAGGAISFRNTWITPKLNPNPYSIARDLAKSGKINFYKDEKGNRITDPKVLGPMLKAGDVISFKNDDPDDQWHTATVLSNDPKKGGMIK